jgi:transposase-like protein
MPVLSHLHHLFNAAQCQAYIRLLRWHDRPLQCPRCQSHHMGQWGTYQYRPGCQRYWCHGCQRTFNDLTDTLRHRSKRPRPYWILATFVLCLACSSSIAGPATAGAGSCAMRPCPMSCSVNWMARSKPMTSSTRRATKGKPSRAGRSGWDAGHAGAGRSASQAVAIMIKIGPRSSPGSVARGRWSSRRPRISPCRRCRRRWTSPSERAGGSIQTQPAAIGRSRAMCTSSSITRRRNMHGERSMRIGPSVCSPCSSRICGCFVASAKRICLGISGSFSSCGTSVSRMPVSRPS